MYMLHYNRTDYILKENNGAMKAYTRKKNKNNKARAGLLSLWARGIKVQDLRKARAKYPDSQEMAVWTRGRPES